MYLYLSLYSHPVVISLKGRAAGGQAPINNASLAGWGKQGRITEEAGHWSGAFPRSIQGSSRAYLEPLQGPTMIFHEDNPVLVTADPSLNVEEMLVGTEEPLVGEGEVEVENMAPFLIQLIKVYTVRNNSEENVER